MANSNVIAAIDKVRVIVLGDSGVGKTSLVHLISHNKVIRSPSWTIGCSVEVKLHEYREGTPVQKQYFIELWDLGGSSAHRNARSVFYTPTHGMILVHDLTNRKSEENLQKWLSEVLNPESCSFGKNYSHYDEFDSENFLGSTQIPILVVGSKLDLLDSKIRTSSQKSRNNIAEQCGCDEIFIDCLDVRSFAAGSSNAVILSRFFDKVIERKYYTREITTPFDKRRGVSTTSFFGPYSPPRLYHMD
ncbi:rab-like protein 3 isoform X2 [Chrysoperla carnea]|uniref:rab-like protein 3 isoform X2 n=1 Tax=Chrysoperla carnea TaxID=189513 RepID=UPI001D08B256|nr:rab-like protein 3 isoform X2 [Chrysoperla carnea]